MVSIFNCNKRFERFFGAKESEIIGKTDYDFVPKELADFFRKKDEESINARTSSTNLEWVTFSDDGHKELLETIKTPVYDGNGNLTGILGIARDITKFKQTEDSLKVNQERLEMAMEMANLGIWEFDVIRRGFYFDDRFYSLYGTTKDKYDKFISLDDFKNKFVHPDDRDRTTYETMKAVKENAPSLSMEHRIIRTNGEIRHVIARMLFSASDNNITKRGFGLMQDITSIKKAELELRELNTSKDKFFSIIAHDLKNPFNTIIGFSEVLKEELRSMDTETIEKYVGLINTSAVQTFRLLENLLEWANSQRGKIVFNPGPVNLHDLVKEELTDLYYMAEEKAIELNNLLPAGFIITADRNMMKTIMRNLITNAIKFTHKNGKVEVKATLVNNKTEVSVSDNGIGMTPETINKLFRLDCNLSTMGTEDEKGTGLGLILCKEFIKKHDGKIWVKSKPGKGSIFRFSLPA